MPVYGLELRQRVIDAVLQGGSIHGVADRFAVSPFFVKSMKKLHRDTGGVARRPSCAGRPRKLAGKEDQLRQCVSAQPDITLALLREALNADISISALANEMHRLKLTFKKSRSTPPSKTALTSKPNAINSESIRPASTGGG